MRRALAAGACALACACAHVSPPPDPVLADLEAGYTALKHGKHGTARERLARALATFDDLALDGGALEHALLSDPKKPYRGRPHERVLTALLVAALDAEAGRCDMTTAPLKNARYFAAKADPKDDPHLPLSDAIARACAHGSALTLELVGDGPTFGATGAHDARLLVSPGGGSDVWARIAIRGRGAGGEVLEASAVALWSSTFEAQHASGRPFDEVLAKRVVHKDEASRVSKSHVDAGLTGVQEAVRDGSLGGDRSALSAAALRLGVGVAAGAAGAAIDARVDTRFVRGLPEAVRARAARAERPAHEGVEHGAPAQ